MKIIWDCDFKKNNDVNHSEINFQWMLTCARHYPQCFISCVSFNIVYEENKGPSVNTDMGWVFGGVASLDWLVRTGLSGEEIFELLLNNMKKAAMQRSGLFWDYSFTWRLEAKGNHYQLCICTKIGRECCWTVWGKMNGAHAVSRPSQGICGPEG